MCVRTAPCRYGGAKGGTFFGSSAGTAVQQPQRGIWGLGVRPGPGSPGAVEAVPKAKPRVRSLSKAQVRQRQKVSVLSVLGVGAAIGLAVMVLMGYIQLTIISDEVVSLQNQLEELQTENVTLTAQHEQMFDLATVKEVAEAAGMSKPSSSQIYYIDLSEGDSAVVYQQEESNLLSRLLTSLNHGIYAVVEYFE